MKSSLEELAIFGGRALSDKILPVGQVNLPDWEKFQKSYRPLLRTGGASKVEEFEERMSSLLNVRHVLAVTNATDGLMLVCKLLRLKGRIALPSFTFAATAQAPLWAGLEPVFCDVDKNTCALTKQTVEPVMKENDIAAILGVHMWGNACDVAGLAELGEKYGARVFYDAAHAVGCTHQGNNIGNFGECEVFSFHATKVLGTTEGGCIATNDQELFREMKKMRDGDSCIPGAAPCAFSPAQAQFGLLSLDLFPEIKNLNREKLLLYKKRISDLPGFSMIEPKWEEEHNCQYAVFKIEKEEFGLDRDSLMDILVREHIHARRYFVPGLHKSPPFNQNGKEPCLPVTDYLCERVLQLPSGANTNLEDIDKICSLLHFIHENSKSIKAKLRKD